MTIAVIVLAALHVIMPLLVWWLLRREIRAAHADSDERIYQRVGAGMNVLLSDHSNALTEVLQLIADRLGTLTAAHMAAPATGTSAALRQVHETAHLVQQQVMTIDPEPPEPDPSEPELPPTWQELREIGRKRREDAAREAEEARRKELERLREEQQRRAAEDDDGYEPPPPGEPLSFDDIQRLARRQQKESQ
jgi:hypothetical protein